jgi:indolepyruvate decarboxylase
VGSIGYTLPAALGAKTAAPDRRTILLIGDGSALLTVQELGTMLHEGHNPVVVLINNDDYTVERAIHGPEQRYNDIPQWNWSLVPAAMGAGECTRTLRATTPAELTEALESVADPQGLVLEAMLPTMDLPEALAAVSRSIAAANASA